MTGAMLPTALALQQAGGAGSSARALPASPFELVLHSTIPTLIVLGVLAVGSIVSWVLIFWKWSEFRRVRRVGDEFVGQMEMAASLRELYEGLVRLPPSPYTRLFRQGINFFTELRPKALREEPSSAPGLQPAQLDTLRLVLEKELAEEHDDLAHGLNWLAIIGTTSPLLGLMGTVVGVMDAFVGISAQGSANIAAVAPGIAEALITTVVGLAVAIPAVIAYNHYASKLGLFAGELEGFASEFIGLLAREGRI